MAFARLITAAGLACCMATGAFADPLPSTLAGTAVAVDPKAPCAGTENHQLDFWLGDWQVYDGKTKALIATDHIDALYGHCVIRQQMQFKGATYRRTGTPFSLAGMSISRFDGQQWVQMWADNQWGAILMKGTRRDDGAIELTSATPSRGRDMRLIWRPVTGGVNIEQFGARAGSGEWERYIDLEYRRAAKTRR